MSLPSVTLDKASQAAGGALGSLRQAGGSGSSVVAALVDAASRHCERKPQRAVIVVNHSSVALDLTRKRCNFCHFRFEALAQGMECKMVRP